MDAKWNNPRLRRVLWGRGGSPPPPVHSARRGRQCSRAFPNSHWCEHCVLSWLFVRGQCHLQIVRKASPRPILLPRRALDHLQGDAQRNKDVQVWRVKMLGHSFLHLVSERPHSCVLRRGVGVSWRCFPAPHLSQRRDGILRNCGEMPRHSHPRHVC